MSINAIQAVTGLQPTAFESMPSLTAPSTAPGTDFSQWITQQANDVSAQIDSAQTELAHLATGETGNLHHVMLELEKAKLAFQLTLQIRNKVLEGYQDIMRMQI